MLARLLYISRPVLWINTVGPGVLVTNLPFLVYFLLSLPAPALLWISLYVLPFVGYSAPPLRFKARPYLDSLSNAAYAFPLVFVPLGLEEPPVWPAAAGYRRCSGEP